MLCSRCQRAIFSPLSVENARQVVLFVVLVFSTFQTALIFVDPAESFPNTFLMTTWEARFVLGWIRTTFLCIALAMMTSRFVLHLVRSPSSRMTPRHSPQRAQVGIISAIDSQTWRYVEVSLIVFGWFFGVVGVALDFGICTALRSTPERAHALHAAAHGEGELSQLVAIRCIGEAHAMMSEVAVSILATIFFPPLFFLLLLYDYPPLLFVGALVLNLSPSVISVTLSGVFVHDEGPVTARLIAMVIGAILLASLCGYVIAASVRDAVRVAVMAKERARALELAKQREVSAVVSGQLAHDVSQAVHCALDALDDDVSQESILRRVHASLRLAVHLLADSMDMAAITEGHLTLRKVVGNFESTLKEVKDVASGIGDAKMKLEIDPSPKWNSLRYDSVRVEQVLLNALSNASKVTAPGGEITIKASLFSSRSKLEDAVRASRALLGDGIVDSESGQSSKKDSSHTPFPLTPLFGGGRGEGNDNGEGGGGGRGGGGGDGGDSPHFPPSTPPLFDVDANEIVAPRSDPVDATRQRSSLGSDPAQPAHSLPRERSEEGNKERVVQKVSVVRVAPAPTVSFHPPALEPATLRGKEMYEESDGDGRKSSEEVVWVWVRVMDCGKGLRGEDPQRLFETFEQSTSAVSDLLEQAMLDRSHSIRPLERVRGRGLGLSMVKRLVLHMNGAASLRDRNDGVQGCEFDLVLPLTRVHQLQISHHSSTNNSSGMGAAGAIGDAPRVSTSPRLPQQSRTSRSHSIGGPLARASRLPTLTSESSHDADVEVPVRSRRSRKATRRHGFPSLPDRSSPTLSLLGRTVFICDDTPLMRRSLKRMVERLGAATEDVHVFSNAEELVEARGVGDDGAVVYCDMELGAGMSGMEAFRALHRKEAKCVRILVSGYCFTDDELADAKAHAQLNKPFNVHQLEIVTTQCLAARRSRTESDTPPERIIPSPAP